MISKTAKQKTKQDIKKEYLQHLENFISEWLEELPHTEEDKEKIMKIAAFYLRKRNVAFGRAQNLAAAILWVYARINFLWESEGKKWQQKSLAKICNVSTGTLGQKATTIMKGLKMYPLDQRFARQEMSDKDPMKKMRVDPRTGLIFVDDGTLDGLEGMPMVKSKHDYYYDAMDCLCEWDADGAARLLRKALEIDEHFVDAYVGMASVYIQKENDNKYREYANKAFAETKRIFSEWPDEMLWGEIENRPFMRAIHLKACVCLNEGNKDESIALLKQLLKMNPGDNQGIRYILAGMYAGFTDKDINKMWDKANKEQNWDDLENLVQTQNKIHGFWEMVEE